MLLYPAFCGRLLRAHRPSLAVALALALSPQAWAGTVPQPEWLTRTLQLESVAYAIGTANADRCDHPQEATGLVLHDLASYDSDERPAVAQRFALGMGFGVLGVVAGSRADQAGLRAGDEIVGAEALNLRTFGRDAIADHGDHTRVTEFTDLLDRHLHAGGMRLTVRNGSTLRQLTLTGAPACGGHVTYVPHGSLNAWSDGENVAVTDAMMHFTRNDNELAFVVAHEFAHNLLHHAEETGRPPKWMAMFGIGTIGIKRDEVAADTFAVDLLDRTRFDARGAEPMIRRTWAMILLDMGLTHPGAARRVSIIETRLAQLAAQRRAGTAS
jgi:hypothetical protein